MTHDIIIKDIRKFLATGGASLENVGDDDDLFALKVIDSLQMLQLVVHIESTYSIVLELDVLNETNFRSLSSIAKLISSRS